MLHRLNLREEGVKLGGVSQRVAALLRATARPTRTPSPRCAAAATLGGARSRVTFRAGQAAQVALWSLLTALGKSSGRPRGLSSRSAVTTSAVRCALVLGCPRSAPPEQKFREGVGSERMSGLG